MSKIQHIAERLTQINGDIFQELCDSFLALRNSNYKAFIRSGSLATKQKSKKGTPDSFFLLPNGSYLFLEATTQQDKLYEKLEQDIRKCMDESKTGIPKFKVREVALCFNSDLSTSEVEQLSNLVTSYETHTALSIYGLSRLSSEISLHHQNLAKDYLGLSLDTGQVVSFKKFVKSHNNSAQKIATPLDNKFLHREPELNSIIEALDLNNLLILTGQPGVGKTRLALEAIEKYLIDRPDFNAYAISNKDADILEDLYLYVQKGSSSVILIDDVNRFDRFSQVLAFYGDNDSSSLKIVLTVRDYALNEISNLLGRYIYEIIAIDKLKDEELYSIIQVEPFEIKNNRYSDKIIEIADGNPRLAIMAAQLAVKEQRIESLADASDLFDKYFSTFINDDNTFGNALILKVLGIVSFFYTIPYNDDQVMGKICDTFELPKPDFVQALDKLEKLELVDLRFEHAKISEQNIATYFFYKIFIKDRLLSFPILLTNYFFSFQNRFKDTVILANNTFGYENVMKRVNGDLRKFWVGVKKGNEENILDYLEHFWFYLQNETLSFLIEQIETYPISSEVEYVFTYETNDYVHDRNRYIQLFGEFLRVGVHTSEVLDLSFSFVRKKPEYLPQLMRELNENFSIDFEDQDSGFIRHKALLKFFEEAYNRGDDLLCRSFLSLCNQLLQYQFQQFKSARGNAIRMYRYILQLNDQSRELRSTLWILLTNLINQYTEESLEVLMDHSRPNIDFNKEMFEFDLKFIIPIIENNLDTNSYKHCHYVNELVRWSKRKEVSMDKFEEWKTSFNCHKYQWFLKVSWDKLRDKELDDFGDWDKYDVVKEKEVRQSLRFDTASEFRVFLDFIAELLSWRGFHNKDNLRRSVDIVLSEHFSRDVKLGFAMLTEFMSYPELKKMYLSGLIKRCANVPELHDKFWLFLEKMQASDLWKIEFLCCLPEHLITPIYLQRLYKLYDGFTEGYFLTFQSYKKYQSVDQNIFENLLEKALFKVENEGLKISLGYGFFEDISPLISDVGLLKRAYLYQQKKESNFHYDHDGKELSILLKRDSGFFLEYLESIFDAAKGHYVSTRDHMELKVIWEMEDRVSTLDKALDILLERPYLGIGEHFMNCFFEGIPNHSEEAVAYLLRLIDRFHHSHRRMNIVFDVIRNSYHQIFNEAFEKFIRTNQDLEVFCRIQWTASGTVVHHGDTNFGDMNAAKWTKLLNLLNSIDLGVKLIPIKTFVEAQIQDEKEQGDMERKRKFLSKSYF